MAGRSVDVSLVIKAVDQSKSALDTVAKSLEAITNAQKAVASGSGDTSKALDNLLKEVGSLGDVFKGLTANADRVEEAYRRQADALARTTASIDARKQKIAELKAVEASYQQQLAKGFVGPRLPDVTRENLRGVTRQIRSEDRGLTTDIATQTRLLETIRQTREATLSIKDAQSQVASATKVAGAEYDRLALSAQKAAEATKKIADAEKLADAQRQANIIRETERARAEAESRRNSAAAQTFFNAKSAPALTRGSAVNNGATFEALAAREDAAAKQELAAANKAAADAYNLFEQRVKQGKAAMDAQAEAMAKLKAYAQGVAESLDPAVRTTRLLAEEQERLAAAVKAGALTSDQANARMKAYRAELEGEAAAAQKASRETEALGTYVDELRRSFDPAGYSARFLEKETQKLNAAMKAGIFGPDKAKAAKDYAAALEVVKKRTEQLGEKQNVRLFGLEPYQTQNLLMQFNDIGTQLASGTSLTQTLAQQGGQIIQLFPQVGNAIVGAMSVGTAAVAAFVVGFGLLVSRTFEAEERIRSLNATLIANADGAAYNAERVVASAKAMREFGVAIEDAMKVANIAINAGLDESKFTAFGEAAKGLALRLGTDVPSAAQRLADALTGGYDALVALDKQTNIFTASELQQIRALVESGDAFKANELAAKILDERLSDVARKAEGPWARATNDLAVSWTNLLDRLSNSAPVSGTVDILTELINKTAELVDWIGKFNTAGGKDSAWFAALFTASPVTGAALLPFLGQSGNSQSVAGGKVNFDNSASTGFAKSLTADLSKADANRRQKANDEVDAARERLAIEEKITSEKQLQDAVAAKRRKLELEAVNQFPLADDNVRNNFVEAQLRIYREGLQKQLDDFNKAAKSELEQRIRNEESALKSYVARVVRTESGGVADARNPNSSATGVGQFINSTWLDTFKKEFPAQAKQLSDAAILSLRTNVEVSKALIERYARENAAILKRAGVGITEANLYLAHFLGPDGAVKVLRANPNASIANVLGGTAGGRAAIAANPTILGGNATAGSVRRFAERRFPGANAGSEVQAQLEGEKAVQDAIDKRAEKQREFNDDLDAEIAKRRQAADGEKELLGLQGEALLNKQKEQAIEEAIAAARRKLRDQLNDPQAELTSAQEQAIRDSVGASFDNKRTSVIASELQSRVSELLALRDTIQAQIRSELERGNAGVARNLEDQLNTVNGSLLDASRELYDYQTRNAEALGLSAEALDTLKLKQDALVESTRTWNSILGLTGQQIANTFTSTAVNALDQFAQAIANGKDAIGSLWDAFRSFAANFLLQIAQMIQQQIIFNLVSGLLSAVGGSGPSISAVRAGSSPFRPNMSGLSSLVANPKDPFNIGMWHTGGLVGANPPGFTSVNPAVFTNAMRYHSGGIAGLKPGEVPAVLMQGEEVLTRDDPRHIMNGGGGSNVKIVNTFDEADFFSKGADTRAGEKAILNMVRANPRAFKAAMNGG